MDMRDRIVAVLTGTGLVLLAVAAGGLWGLWWALAVLGAGCVACALLLAQSPVDDATDAVEALLVDDVPAAPAAKATARLRLMKRSPFHDVPNALVGEVDG